MQQHPTTNVHERADSPVTSGSSDMTRLPDNGGQSDHAQLLDVTKPKQVASISRDRWPSYTSADDPVLLAGYGTANPAASHTIGVSLEARRAFDLTLKAKRALRDRIREREAWWQRSRTRSPEMCDAQERVGQRSRVWMVVTPEDVRAPVWRKADEGELSRRGDEVGLPSPGLGLRLGTMSLTRVLWTVLQEERLGSRSCCLNDGWCVAGKRSFRR